MKKTYKILVALSLAVLSFLFVGCGSSANANLSIKIERTMNNLSSTIKKIENISEEDLIVSDIMPTRTMEMTLPKNYGTTSDRQIVDYNQVANTNQQWIPQNCNTYYPNNIINNVNSFTNQTAYNGCQYGNCSYPYRNYTYPNSMYQPYMYPNNSYTTNQNFNNRYGYTNNPNRVISNVNTYGLGKTNVNTYQNAKAENEYGTNITLQNYFTKLSNLYSVASNVVNTNVNINNVKNSILAKISSVKTLCSQLKTKDELKESEAKSINTLLENINTYINKLNFTKNEVRTELNSVRKLKNNYTSNIEQLSSKYVRLTNCLDSRCSYYNNILSCLFGLENCLGGNCDFGDPTQNYICQDCLKNLLNNNQNCPNGVCPDGTYADNNCNDYNCSENQNNKNNSNINQNSTDQNCVDDNCNDNQCTNGDCDKTTENKIVTKDIKKQVNIQDEKQSSNNHHEKQNYVKNPVERTATALPAHPKKNDYINVMPMEKHEPDILNKDDPYSIMPKKNTQKTDKKIYKFIDTNLPNNSDNSNQTEDLQNKDVTTTGNFYIIKYYSSNY